MHVGNSKFKSILEIYVLIGLVIFYWFAFFSKFGLRGNESVLSTIKYSGGKMGGPSGWAIGCIFFWPIFLMIIIKMYFFS
jgi:hypothetical protein